MRPQYEDTLQATSAGRREHVGARADLKVVAADISKQLRLLDKVVRYRFGDSAELMGRGRVPAMWLSRSTPRTSRSPGRAVVRRRRRRDAQR